MSKPIIDADACTGCTICVEECPTSCLEMQNDVSALVRPDECTGCGTCEEICPVSAITME
jgi:NAD-dependent dihydropyrimidine dehydrogenase PreA subunit